MEFQGREYTGKGITVAIVDSGIDSSDPRLAGAEIEGWSIRFGATGHALLSADFADESGHGTEVAAAVHRMAPDARLVAVRIMDARLRTSADLMAAGLETASRHGAHVVNLSLGTPNMGKALLLRDCCALAVDNGSTVLAAGHPRGDRAYPADLPETIGVSAHPDCPLDAFYWFDPNHFPPSRWKALSGKFVAHGYAVPPPHDREARTWRGSAIATAYMSGRVACLREAMPQANEAGILKSLQDLALTPSSEHRWA